MFILNKSELAAATSPHKAAVRFAGDPEYRPLRSDRNTLTFEQKSNRELSKKFLKSNNIKKVQEGFSCTDWMMEEVILLPLPRRNGQRGGGACWDGT